MAWAWRWLVLLVGLTAAGCSTTPTDATTDTGPRRGALLTTGGTMLAPNVGKDFVGWQGDGHVGF